MTVPVGDVVLPAALITAVNVTGVSCFTLVADASSKAVVSAAPAPTLTLMLLEVEALNVLVPAYAAVIDAIPAGSAVVVNVALPLDSTAVPIFVAPLKKFTDPLGVLLPLAGFTMAVSVIGEL